MLPLGALRDVASRFPASVACALALFVLFILSVHDVIGGKNEVLSGHLMILSACGFFWFGIARLMAESGGWGRSLHAAVALAGFAALGAAVFLEPGEDRGWFVFSAIPALLLLLGAAPYLVRGRGDASSWCYGWRIAQGLAVAALAGGVWGGGLSLALLSIDKLFDVRVNDKIYTDLWAFSLAVFAPLYGLTWAPRVFTFGERDFHAPPPLAFILNWVMAPLVLIYMAILYAYLGKVLLVQEMPRGILSWMICVFGALGVATYVAGWPLRETGGPLLRGVYRVFLPGLILPVIMLFVAAGLRIQQYGVTPERYMVMLGAIWLGAVAAAYSFRRWPLKYIPLLLAGLLFAASCGPLSAVAVSAWSQYARLESLMAKNGILADGRIVKSAKEISFEDRAQISSAIEAVIRTGRVERLQGWTPDLDWGKPDGNRYFRVAPADVAGAMGVGFIDEYDRRKGVESKNYLMLQLRQDHGRVVVAAKGYEFFTLNAAPMNFLQDKEVTLNISPETSPNDEKAFATLSKQGGQLAVVLGGRAPVLFDIQALAERAHAKNPGMLRDIDDMSMEKHENGVRVKLVFDRIDGEIKDGRPVIDGLSFWLFAGTDE